MKKLLSLLAFCAILFISCTDDPIEKDSPKEQGKEQEEQTETLPARVTDQQKEHQTGMPVSGLRLAWNVSSAKDFGGGTYPRAIRLRNGVHLLAYEAGGNVCVASTVNDGYSWKQEAVIKSYSSGGINVNACNAEIFELANGTLICAANYRPAKDGVEPWSIAINRSFDGGASWEGTRILYKADVKSSNGCWEPCTRQLPNGQVQIYFANEGPYRSSSEQEISMIWSDDNGDSWSEDYKTVCFRKGKRDGMPVPAIFGDEIVVSIEDNKVGEFKPSTVRCKISDNWSAPVTADSPDRDYSLIEGMPNSSYLGAPYLVKLPGGEAMLSYQSNDGRSSKWDLSCMEIAIGDKQARNFKDRYRPFSVDNNTAGLWNSLCVWDDNTVMVLSAVGPTIKTKRVHLLYEDSGFYFIGANGADNLRCQLTDRADRLSFVFDVADRILFKSLKRTDGVTLFIDTIDDGSSKPYAGIFKIEVSYLGEVQMWEGNNGKWTEIDHSCIKTESKIYSTGYGLNVDVDKSAIGPLGKSVRVGMIHNNWSDAYTGYTEELSGVTANDPCSWIRYTLK